MKPNQLAVDGARIAHDTGELRHVLAERIEERALLAGSASREIAMLRERVIAIDRYAENAAGRTPFSRVSCGPLACRRPTTHGGHRTADRAILRNPVNATRWTDRRNEPPMISEFEKQAHQVATRIGTSRVTAVSAQRSRHRGPMLTIRAQYASASEDGDYFQVAFEDRRNEEGRRIC
jgi:hypothetical protein